MLIGGFYIIITSKVPSFLVSGGKYQLEGWSARLIGLFFLLPLPGALLSSLLMAFLFGKQGAGYALSFEFVLIIVICISVILITRLAGKRIEIPNNIEAKIAKKSQGALIYTLLSMFGITSIVCCPLAIIYATQAIKLINKHGLGENYRRKAKFARFLAVVITSMWVMVFILIILFHKQTLWTQIC